MVKKEIIFKKLIDAVINYKEDDIEELCNDVIKNKIDPNEAVLDGLAAGMQKVGRLYDDQEYGIPEVLLCAEVFKLGTEIFRPYIKSDSTDTEYNILIGTVEGDIHSIGKNIVKLMMESSGFNVIDLGEDVSAQRFIDYIKHNIVDIVGLSTMMSTTLFSMENIIEEIKKIFPDMKFIIGGASVSDNFAKKCGADIYAENAIAAVNLVNNFISSHK